MSTDDRSGPMHVLLVLDSWGMVGGTERHAVAVVPELVERGHRVSVLVRVDDGTEPHGGAEVLAFAALEGRGMARTDRRALAERLDALSPDVVLHSACANLDAAEVLLSVAPVVRYVHDHVLFCPGLNKLHADGSICRETMGAACFAHYFTGGGCAFFRREFHRNSLVDPCSTMLAKWRELALARRAREVLTNSRSIAGRAPAPRVRSGAHVGAPALHAVRDRGRARGTAR